MAKKCSQKRSISLHEKKEEFRFIKYRERHQLNRCPIVTRIRHQAFLSFCAELGFSGDTLENLVQLLTLLSSALENLKRSREKKNGNEKEIPESEEEPTQIFYERIFTRTCARNLAAHSAALRIDIETLANIVNSLNTLYRMAVKKRGVVQDSSQQLDLVALAQYIQLMTDQPNYLPSQPDLVKHCQDIVKCLARTSGTEEELWEVLQSVEEFLLRLVNKLSNSQRHELITAILEKFYSFTSDPQSDACPATSAVLIVLHNNSRESHKHTARWIVENGRNCPAGAGLRATLSCLYRWLYEWHGTATLGDWVLAFIEALEENQHYDILIEVSVDNLSRLFVTLNNPLSVCSPVADVIIHILASLRESTEALDAISPHVPRILVSLAADSGQWSRQLLQNVVDVLTIMIDHQVETLKGEALDMFKDKYVNVILCLERHMATSRGIDNKKQAPWRASNEAVATTTQVPRQKVGLLNLGNTCYMNSVVQALLVTRQFSTQVMLKMSGKAYWAKMAQLFAKMTHSMCTELTPDEFFKAMKPPFFSWNQQHDSSEFLGYMFELLTSYEHVSDINFDYSRPAVLRSAGADRLRAITAANSSSESDGDAGPNRRSVSPRPGSSAAGCSGSHKRLSSEPDTHAVRRKRPRKKEPAVMPRESFVDSMFGGVLLTRVECTECHSTSLSRDVFRDLQLAFPDKPDGWQHSVQSLLDYYCSTEHLTGVNQYACRDCGGLRDAERCVVIETPPKYLILVLKNFKFDPKLKVQTKLMHSSMEHNTMVSLPTIRSQAGHAKYTLYAVVIHTGTTLNSGHYHTLAKENDKWFSYNDESVTEDDVEGGELAGLKHASTPYILFYRRNDIEEGPIPALDDLAPSLQESVLSHNKACVETLRMVLRSRP